MNVLIAEAIRKNSLTSGTTVKDVEVELGKWLTGARDRGGKRAERAKAAKDKKQQRARERAERDGQHAADPNERFEL